MKSWGMIRYKHLFSSESNSDAASPVVGSILMLLILVLLVGSVAVTFFNVVGEGKNSQPLMTRISIESCEGGLRYAPKGENSTFENNSIVLIHEGGSPLPGDVICILIFGNGNAYQGEVGKGGIFLKGDTEVIYQNLIPTGKNPRYESKNKEILKDNLWSAGEKLTLHGDDSAIGSIVSSVKVSVNGDSNTSDNYGFKVGSEITVKVIDVKSRNVIAEQKAIVKHYEG
jgi:archaeal type IV pilus assembly protein PilA